MTSDSKAATREKVEQARKLLERIMRAQGHTRLEIDRRIGSFRGYVSQVFTGKLALRLEHIVSILDAMGIEPLDFFELAFPRSTSSPDERRRTAERLLGGIEPAPAAVPPPAPASLPSMAELEELIDKAVSRAMQAKQAAPPKRGTGRKPPRRS